MSAMLAKNNENIQELTPEEGKALFDKQARLYMGMSGEEFVKAYEAGELDDRLEDPKVMRLYMMMPLVK